MALNNSIDHKIINLVTEKNSALVYLYNDRFERFNEIHYLSQGLFSAKKKNTNNPEIIFTCMFNKPFLFFIQERSLFKHESLISTLKSFYQGNSSNGTVLLLDKEKVISPQKIFSETSINSKFI